MDRQSHNNIFMVMNPRGLCMATVRPIAVNPQMTHSTDKKRDNVKPWSQIMSHIIGNPFFYLSGSVKMIFSSQLNVYIKNCKCRTDFWANRRTSMNGQCESLDGTISIISHYRICTVQFVEFVPMVLLKVSLSTVFVMDWYGSMVPMSFRVTSHSLR